MRYVSRVAFFIALLGLMTPPVLFTPRIAHAQVAVAEAGPNLIQNTIQAVKSSISAVADVSDEINSWALRIKAYVLDPLAFVMSGNLLKSITAGTIGFINGSNSSGRPLFVQNLSQQLLNTGDIQALSFFDEFRQNSNSPFANTLLSSLRLNYLQGTSAAGFWSANQCTLSQVSANPLAFVGGNFSQGGWAAWFSLTTQPQNNPYTLYSRIVAERDARIASAAKNLLSELSWGDGFMSWCGSQTSTGGSTADADGIEASVAITSQNNCTTSDGKPGTIQTPGSVIRDGLQKALGTDIDKLINVGDAGATFSKIVGNLSSTLQVVAYGASILGQGNSGGLYGVSHPSGSTPVSILDQYRNSADYLGLTNAAIGSTPPPVPPNPDLAANAAAAQAGVQLGQGTGASADYQAAWQTIGTAANSALTSLNKVLVQCGAPYNANATNVITSVVQPLIQQAAFASQAAPTVAQIVQAQSDAQTTNGASAQSCGSFGATGGTMVDRLNIIKTNAEKAAAACNAPVPYNLLLCAP